jgi:hypothetical protein
MEHIVQFYNSLFSAQFNWQLKLASLAFDSIDAKGEVFEVLKGMNSDKARGLGLAI